MGDDELRRSLATGEGLQPDAESETERPRERLAVRLIIGQTVATAFLTLMTAAGGVLASDPGLFALLPLGAIAAAVGLVSYAILRRGRFRLAGYVFALGTCAAISANVFVRGYRDASSIYYLWPILSATVTLAAWDGFAIATVSTLAYLILVFAQRAGYQTPSLPYNPDTESLLTVGSRLMMFFLLAFLARISNQGLNQALQRARQTAQRWQELNEKLEDHVVMRTEELNQRAAELEENARQSQRRTTQLEAAAQVIQAVSAVLDPDERLNRVVNLISEHFGHYHVGAFMLDETGRWAALRAANSESGRRMVARGYLIAIAAEGIVNSAIRMGEPRIAFKEGVDAIYFDDTNLPNSRSEMALPLIARDQIIGALDVHSTEPDAFDEEDMAILSTLAGQLAISLDNARLREASQATLSQLEALQRRYIGQAWEDYTAQQEADLYEYRAEEPTPDDADEAPSDGLVVPIRMRGGHVVGTLGVQATQQGTKHGWSTDQRALVETVAEQVAQAMEAAQLFDETRRLAQRERLVAEITGKIRAAPDIDSILRTAVQEIRRALRASHGVIRLGTETYLRPPEMEDEKIEIETRDEKIEIETRDEREEMGGEEQVIEHTEPKAGEGDNQDE
jgi:GAF domain-containing protein